MSDEIKPALTADEWKQNRRVGGHCVFNSIAIHDSDGRRVATYKEGEAWIVNTHDSGSGADGWGISIEAKHALAAVCLQGHPAGFTWEDVDALRHMIRSYEDESHHIVYGGRRPDSPYDRALSLADRIAALLPPR